jgi:hypothetical protein
MKKLTFAYREEQQGPLFSERKRNRKLGKVYDDYKEVFLGWRLAAMGWEGDDFVLDYRRVGWNYRLVPR